MQKIRRALLSYNKQVLLSFLQKKQYSTELIPTSEKIEKSNFIFSNEKKRQIEEVGRVEKITVAVSGPPEDVVLVMNQNISTPYDCCRHISLPLCERSPLALVDDKYLWDMHRPLPQDCSLKFLSFKDKDPYSVNEAFWRTGSFILGAVISKAFKDEISLKLHRFPVTNVSTGSFFYDAVMNIGFWEPTNDELKVLSAEFLTFVRQNHKIERLDVKKTVALEIFEGNEFKEEEVRNTFSPDNLVTLYRVADHIDICFGPMVGDTSFFGRSSIASVHFIKENNLPLYRFQGVALPKGILLNSYAFGVLTGRAVKLNEAEIPDMNVALQPLNYDKASRSIIHSNPDIQNV